LKFTDQTFRSTPEERAAQREVISRYVPVFPFARGGSYALQMLQDFETSLAAYRQQDEAFSKALRNPSAARWLNLRQTELLPLLHVCRHWEIDPSTPFQLMPDGHPVDIELGSPARKLQFTTAGADWGDGNWGWEDVLRNDVMNREGHAPGWGAIELRDGRIHYENCAIDTPTLVEVHRRGLRRALLNKAHAEPCGCELVVYAVGYQQLPGKVLDQMSSVLTEHHLQNFTCVHVVDGNYYAIA